MNKSSSWSLVFTAIGLVILSQLIGHVQLKCTGKVLVVGFDGFRWDYLSYFHKSLPTLNRLAATGVLAANGFKPVFVTNTNTNFWSLATGLYAENHGLIDNTFYDPQLRMTFNDSHNPIWYSKSIPIWSVVQKAGKRTGVYGWYASDVPINGSRPNYLKTYKMSAEGQVDTVVNWLTKYRLSVDLAMLYFGPPDMSGHNHGSLSKEVGDSLAKLDALVARLLKQLDERGCLDQLNLLLVSDHGMTDIKKGGGHVIELKDYIDLNHIKVILEGALVGIRPQAGVSIEYIYDKLVDAHPEMNIYYKEQIPARFHYKHNRRVPPIVALANPGYLISMVIIN